jgi:hypothetical protein
MPLNKEAFIRYKIIDASIKNAQKPYPNIEEIIEKCEEKLGKTFSISTIQKDIKSMKEDDLLGFNAPIKYSKSNNGYYYSEKYDFGQIPLKDNEIEALWDVSELLEIYSDSRVSESFDLALSKIMASLSEKFERGENKLPIVVTENPPKQRGWEFFDFFLNAIKSKTVVSFIHYSYHKNCFSATALHPYQLIEFGNYWYIIGFSEKHKELRTYGLERIYDPIEYSILFNGSKINEVKKYNEDMYGVMPLSGLKKQIVYFNSSPFMSKFLTAHPIHHSQQIKQHYEDGRKLFSINVIPTLELIRWFFANSTDVLPVKNDLIVNELNKMFKNSKLY